jgi:hypothetical protein
MGRVTRTVLVALLAFMGLAGVVSGPALVATNGLGMPVEWLAHSPFESYAIPGMVLFAVGSANLAAAVALLLRHRWGPPLSFGAGLLWMGWFVVQVAVVGLVSWQQPVYFVVGLAITTLAQSSPSGQPHPGTLHPRHPGPQ